MREAVAFWVKGYQPECEGWSKEVRLLHHHFPRSFIHNLSFDLEFRLERQLVSYPDRFHLLKTAIPPLEARCELSHVYSFCDESFYSRILHLRPRIITAVGPGAGGEISKFHLRFDHVVVECERDQQAYRAAGVPEDRLSLVYPPSELGAVPPRSEDQGRPVVLWSSTPYTFDDFQGRGGDLILGCANRLPQVDFIVVCRGDTAPQVRATVEGLGLANVEVTCGIVDMGALLARADLSIIPYRNGNYKSCPTSMVESISAGRPVVVTPHVGAHDLVVSTGCGMVVESSAEALAAGVSEILTGMDGYSAACEKTAGEYFSCSRFIKAYEEIYSSVLDER